MIKSSIETATANPVPSLERTKARRVFTPRVDILETEKDIVLVADMPGVPRRR